MTIPNDGQPSKNQTFTSPPSTRAIALVGIAVLVGILLVVIVNSDKKGSKTAKKATTETTTTTAASSTETTEQKSDSTTSTTQAVANTSKPSEVSVLVLNGSNIAGVASTITGNISSLKYKTLTAGNDSSKDKGTFVYYKSGFENDAKQLATNIVPGLLTKLKMTQTVKTQQFPSSAPVAWDQQDLVAANVVIIIGNGA